MAEKTKYIEEVASATLKYLSRKDNWITGPNGFIKVIKQALEEWFENHPIPKERNKSKPISR